MRLTTALLMVGPKSVAPWGDRVWRLAASAQLVEGSEPYWIVTPTQPAQHPVTPTEVSVATPHPETLVESIIYFLAAHFGDGTAEQHLVSSHNLEVIEGERRLVPFFDLNASLISSLSKSLSQQLRLGLTRLDDMSLVSAPVIQKLEEMGFDLEVFSLESKGMS